VISTRIRAMAAPHWIGLYGLVLAGWFALFLMALPDDLRVMGQMYGAEFWAALCVPTPDLGGFLRLVGMWLVMSAAMMLPTALPAFATYDDLGSAAPTQFGHLVAGYGAVWAGFSVLAGGLQFALFQADLVSAFGDSRSVILSSALLFAAGAYQFTPLKEACLSKCRAPLTFFITHWDAGAWRNGLRLGLVCLGCCWALMLLAFVGGVMNLAFMGLATLVMIFEKLPDVGRFITRPLGALLIGAALWLPLTTL